MAETVYDVDLETETNDGWRFNAVMYRLADALGYTQKYFTAEQAEKLGVREGAPYFEEDLNDIMFDAEISIKEYIDARL